MRYEQLITLEEKNKWLELEVTLGTNDALIGKDLSRLRNFLKTFNDLEKRNLEATTTLSFNLESPLSLEDNPKLLKLLLIKKFIEQHGLSVIREAKSNQGLSEKTVFLEVSDGLFNRNEYPEKIYVYAAYRQRGSPNTWLKVISNLTADEVEQKLESKTRALQSYINHHLRISRKFRFKETIGSLAIFVFSKAIPAKVMKGETKNLEVQRATYTMVVFDKSENKLGVVTGSRKEVQLIQRYIRYRLLPDSIGTPRSELEKDRKDILKKILASNGDRFISLNSVSFKTTLLPGHPSVRLKVNGSSSVDDALNALPDMWNNLGIEALRNVDYQFQGKIVNVYIYGDEWKRIFINTTAKRNSRELENYILDDLNQRLGTNVKETSFIVEPLTDEYILEKIFIVKRVASFPPVPKQVEGMIIRLIGQKIIKEPTKISRRRCSICYGFSWNDWNCPNCDRESMIVVGEAINIELVETVVIRKLAKLLPNDLPNFQVKLIPYKQRRNYKKTVIKIYNPTKNLSVFILLISDKKDLPFVEDLLHEGFGVIGIIDPELGQKADYLERSGCNLVPLHLVVNRLVNGSDRPTFLTHVEDQERKVLERIFANLRMSLNKLNNKPNNYDEDMFEIDITNLFQAIVPDVIRLGTEHKGRSVPDGYCCYGYKELARKKRLFGWDAKYSIHSNYRLGSTDLVKQKRYLAWLSAKNSEPAKIGSLGIYAFISNFDSATGFNTTLTNLTKWDKFPRQCRLILVQDKLLVEICEWILAHWQQVIDNNSLISEVTFKWFRRNTAKSFNTLHVNDWHKLEKKLNQIPLLARHN